MNSRLYVLIALLLTSTLTFGQQSDPGSAIANGDINAIKLHIDSGGNVNHVIDGKGTLLQAALYSRNAELSMLLIEAGADVNLVSEENDEPPLSLAVQMNNLELLKLLLSNNADPNGEDISGRTPIFNTLSTDRPAARILLIQNGADVNKSLGKDYNVVIAAMLYGNPNAIKHLLEHDAEIDGELVAEKSACAHCHSSLLGPGVTSASFAPHLAGQHAAYIKKQIQDYQNKRRADSRMGNYVDVILHDIGDRLAAYYESLPRYKNSSRATEEVLSKGKHLYEQHCSSCHGSDGIATRNKLTPTLAGLNSTYVEIQMTNFQSGIRFNDADADMRNIAATLSKEQISDVSEYIQSMY